MLLKILFVSLVLGIAYSNGAPSCCTKVRVNDGRQKQWGNAASGVYYANFGTINGRAHYTSKEGGLAIWYDSKNWAIGLESVQVFKDVEENWNGVFHFVSSKENCPNNLDPWTWKYRDGYVWENTQVGLSIVCEN